MKELERDAELVLSVLDGRADDRPTDPLELSTSADELEDAWLRLAEGIATVRVLVTIEVSERRRLAREGRGGGSNL